MKASCRNRGDRVRVVKPTGTRHFVYDSQGRVVAEYGASASEVKAEFIWALPPAANDNSPFGGDDGIVGYAPLALVTTNTSSQLTLYWVHGNHLGVPMVTTNALGQVVDPGSDFLRPGFPGQSQVLSDLYYNRARDYDPVLGRYIQADPIGLLGGANPYLYANGDPVNMVDPDGKNPIVAAIAACELAPIACAAIIAGVVYYGGRLIDACINTDWPQVQPPILELGPKKQGGGRRSPAGRCSSCGTPTGGSTGTTECPDCDAKRKAGYPVKGENPKPLW